MKNAIKLLPQFKRSELEDYQRYLREHLDHLRHQMSVSIERQDIHYRTLYSEIELCKLRIGKIEQEIKRRDR